LLQNLNKFGAADIEEMIEDAVIAAVHDQVAGLDVITDGEQTRLDFNLSFYGFIKGIEKMKPKQENLARLHMTSVEKIILLEI
jgi:methionine synthase II (cobalamin-independent)